VAGHKLSYEELAFHLEDSASFRAFARLPLSWTPKKAALHMPSLPGSSQADPSTPSPIKLSLDRPELGSNPHRSPVLSCDVQERLFLKIMDGH
jgi:hypothetical protein